ncbi:MAG: hypothetical protein HQ574_02665 [Chloroflexi bacterium]|nr:hypothetical protein [Chloroflexota bacterium]
MLSETVSEALKRLKSGQEDLAIHKNCGTNLLVSGFAAGLAGAAGMIGAGNKARDKFERIPTITLFSVLALMISRPLGPWVQKKLTTSGNPGSLSITSITKHTLNGTPAHRVKTRA